MMTRALLLLVCLCAFFAAWGQGKFEKPDYTEIKKLTADKSGRFYYPTLLKRYRSNDTTLQIGDFYLLYYGNFFYKDVRKYNGDYTDSVNTLMHKEGPSATDLKKLIGFTKKQLDQSPFDIGYLDRMHRLYRAAGDTVTAERYLYKLEMLVKSIVSTGDGRSCATAMHVLQAADEYALLSLLGYEYAAAQSLKGIHCNYLNVKPNDDGLEGIYFDVGQILGGYMKMFDDAYKKRIKKAKKR